MVLNLCAWAHDVYNLNIENLPHMEHGLEQQDLLGNIDD